MKKPQNHAHFTYCMLRVFGKGEKTFKLNQRVIRLGGMLMRTAKNVNEHAHFSTKQFFGNDKLRS